MILTIGPGGCGFTFINWSISYLRGDCYYTTLDGMTSQVISNPLKDVTAHKAIKDHLRFKESKQILDRATDSSIIYVTPGSQEDLDLVLKKSVKKIIFDGSVMTKEFMARAYFTIPNNDEDDMLFKLVDTLDKKYGANVSRPVILECAHWFCNYYHLPKFNDRDCMLINYIDVFQNLKTKIHEIFDFLSLDIDQTRLSSWIKIYEEYKKLNVGFADKFLNGADNNPRDFTLSKIILKELIDWRHTHRHLINSN